MSVKVYFYGHEFLEIELSPWYTFLNHMVQFFSYLEISQNSFT
ncbi:hypothetical protein CHCC20497_2083 [Bacillus paralicheniformis]|nr:hypothetical protein CHCC20497_2083 [Bacillus paralicheniformis]